MTIREFKDILTKYTTIGVLFVGKNCPACVQSKQHLYKLQNENTTNTQNKIIILDSEKDEAVFQQYKIFTIPALIYFKNTKPIDIIVGHSRALVNKISNILNA